MEGAREREREGVLDIKEGRLCTPRESPRLASAAHAMEDDDDVLVVQHLRGQRVSVFWSFSLPFVATTVLLVVTVALSAVGVARANDAVALETTNHAEVMGAVGALRSVADADCSLGSVVWKQHESGDTHDFIVTVGSAIRHNRSNTLGTHCHDTFAAMYEAYDQSDTVEPNRRLEGINVITIGGKGFGFTNDFKVKRSTKVVM